MIIMKCNCYRLVKGDKKMFIDRDVHSDTVRFIARQEFGVGAVVRFPTNHDDFADNRVDCDNCGQCRS